MDANVIISAIGTLGFPIVAAAAMFWLVQKQSEQHREEVNKLSEVITELKIAVNTLIERINGG